MTTNKQHDHLNRLLQIAAALYTSAAVSSAYVPNDANQRIQATLADGSYWRYEYDTLGQVTSGKKYWVDGTPVAGQQFEYTFGDIGNRTATKAGGDERGAALRAASSTPNLLNQVTNRTVPGAVDVMGAGYATATVTVQGQATHRKGEYYRAEVSLNNASAPVWQAVTNTATEGGNTSNVWGNVWLDKTPRAFRYDADGNLTNDGRWSYSWDEENRLTNLTSVAGVPSGACRKLDFTYDYFGRRIRKRVSTLVGTNYVAQSTNRFVYDGWNLLAILDHQSSLLYSFTWGLDLSGTRQGAGGVGGLLAMIVHSVNGSVLDFDKSH